MDRMKAPVIAGTMGRGGTPGQAQQPRGHCYYSISPCNKSRKARNMDNNTKEFVQLVKKLNPDEKKFIAQLMIDLLEQQEREGETDENR